MSEHHPSCAVELGYNPCTCEAIAQAVEWKRLYDSAGVDERICGASWEWDVSFVVYCDREPHEAWQ